jgi:hypothetical protein
VGDFMGTQHGHLRVHFDVHIDVQLVAHFADETFFDPDNAGNGLGDAADFYPDFSLWGFVHQIFNGRPQLPEAVPRNDTGGNNRRPIIRRFVTVATDENGIEAGRFGAETSGHTLVFYPSGTLVFSGGITASRGHAGNNAGENAVLAAITQRSFDLPRTSVFGCSLTKRNSIEEDKACSK